MTLPRPQRLTHHAPPEWTPYHHWMWFWCWLCYRLFLALPLASFNSRYHKFTLWLLGYGGCYAYSTREDFHFCAYFFDSPKACQEAWAKHLGEETAAP